MKGHLFSPSLPDIMFVVSLTYINMLNLPPLLLLVLKTNRKRDILKVLDQIIFPTGFSNSKFADKL